MATNKLHEFRISKYNLELQEKKQPSNNEWTSFSDIGRCLGGKIVTLFDYIKAEDAYLEVVSCICNKLAVSKMQVVGIEDYDNLYPFGERYFTRSKEEIITITRDCLREKYWCKLITHHLELHFGYDFYLYVCTTLDPSNILDITNRVGLFVEFRESPYK